jgi:hypothetical protein
MNSTLDADPPTNVKGTVGRGRLPNAHYPVREYLTTRAREREGAVEACCPTGMGCELPSCAPYVGRAGRSRPCPAALTGGQERLLIGAKTSEI